MSPPSCGMQLLLHSILRLRLLCGCFRCGRFRFRCGCFRFGLRLFLGCCPARATCVALDRPRLGGSFGFGGFLTGLCPFVDIHAFLLRACLSLGLRCQKHCLALALALRTMPLRRLLPEPQEVEGRLELVESQKHTHKAKRLRLLR